MSKLTAKLPAIAEQIRTIFSNQDAARERVLPLCRETIRHSSEAIRAIHRQEFDNAAEKLRSARRALDGIEEAVGHAPELAGIGAGFARDAQKEFAEGSITYAIVTGKEIPGHAELGVDPAAYLNGLGEAVGELRRYMLDAMRTGDLSRGEEILSAMDDIYGELVTMDFPDAITMGLRRTTDMVRGVLERTRSDLSLTLRQMQLERKLDLLETSKKEDSCP